MNVLQDNMPVKRRAMALDALRGLTILLMVFAGMIPWGVLPAWMYHTQEPPPLHAFRPDIPGISWVDLVFPFFLFTMGAAIPLSLTKRIASGSSPWNVARGLLWRGILLAGFAIFLVHVEPRELNPTPGWREWMLGLLGFAMLFPVLARLPQTWSKQVVWMIRAAGGAGCVLFMVFVRYPDDSGFSLYRSDIIILVLANVALFGGLVWLLSRGRLLLRLGIMGVLVASRLSASIPGWGQIFWNCSPVPWLFQVSFLQYLLIALPGTIAGELVLHWMESPTGRSDQTHFWDRMERNMILVLLAAVVVVVVPGLFARWGLPTLIAAALLCSVVWACVRNAVSSTEVLVRSLFRWGAYWLMLGLLLEPFEGGIKKDPATLSYYFVTSGLAGMVLCVLIILTDIMRQAKYFRYLAECGQNPLVAYAAVPCFVLPLLSLTGAGTVLEWLTPTPWLGVLRGAFMTSLVALTAVVCTRRGIFLRA